MGRFINQKLINMNNRNIDWLFALICATLLFSYSCKKDYWDQHTEIRSQDLSSNLLEEIEANPDLSSFNEALKNTGISDSLKLSKVFTVWAPNNTAMAALSVEVKENPVELLRFVKFHIAYQSHFRPQDGKTDTVRTIGGKNAVFNSSTFEDASLITADRYLANGVLHIVDEASLPLVNAWEFLSASQATALKNYIATVHYKELDVSKGEVLYIDPVSKQPVYREGTTFWVEKNYFNQRVGDLANEDSLYTFIVLNDALYDSEKKKLTPYFKNDNQHLIDSITQWNVVKDLCVRGVVSENQLSSGVISTQGGRFSISPSAIIQKKKLSNGVAYVVNALNYQLLENKIPTIMVEGEMLDSARAPSVPQTKIRRDLNGNRFVDNTVESITSSPDPLNYFRYLTTVNSTRYKIFIRALNDIYQVPFQMRVDFSTQSYFPKAAESALSTTGYFDVLPFNTLSNPYQEILIGEYEPQQYGDLYVFLVSAATGVSSTLPTALSIDYIKLVPVN